MVAQLLERGGKENVCEYLNHKRLKNYGNPPPISPVSAPTGYLPLRHPKILDLERQELAGSGGSRESPVSRPWRKSETSQRLVTGPVGNAPYRPFAAGRCYISNSRLIGQPAPASARTTALLGAAAVGIAGGLIRKARTVLQRGRSRAACARVRRSE